jgi:pimeloyl-ACP methyl ester carboxylesterase
VSSLVLCDTTSSASTRTYERLEALDRLGPRGMAEQRAPRLVGPNAPTPLIAELTDIMAEVRPAGYRPAAIALGKTDLTARLSSIQVPTLVIHGEHDGVVPLATGQALAAAIPGARLVVIPDAGHVSNQEQPAAFNAAVREFILSVD